MDFYATTWQCRDQAIDEKTRRCEILAHGKTRDSSSPICVRIPFHPGFYVEIPSHKQGSTLEAKGFMYALLDEIRGLKKDLCQLVRRKPFVGFRNGEKRLYVMLAFENLASYKRVKYNSKETLHEAACDPLLKFFHSSGLPATGWIRVEQYTVLPKGDPGRISHDTVLEYVVSSPRALRSCAHEMDTVTPPLVLCSWDIEAYSKSGNFPDASNIDDAIITIGAVYALVGSDEPFRRSVHVLGSCHDIDGVDVHRYDTEASLVMGFMYETIRFRTDFLLAWNSYGFDHRYIDGRAVTLLDYETGESQIDLKAWGRLLDDPQTGMLMDKRLASSAYGDNTYYYQHTPGMISIDALQIFRKETKHDSYTLDNISRHYLGSTKIDLKPWEMFEKYRDPDPAGRTQIAKYCIRDCELPLRLVHKMNMLNNLFEFSKVTSVPIDWLLLRGQQIRVYSLILRHARQRGFVVPDMQASVDDDNPSFMGAVVLEPLPGGYTEDIVSVMDFASLYPSIMMAHHMCATTLVLDPAYRGLEGVEYYEVEAAPGVTVCFAQSDDNVIPNLLYELKRMRKEAKKDMETADNSFTRGLLDSRQLSYKLVMNSLYGALGSTHGLLCGLKKIPMSVTSTGRWMITQTKHLVETLLPGSRVIYGDTDSVLCILDCGAENRQNMSLHFETATNLAAEITGHFQRPHELEMEKAFFPFFLCSKKRYTGLKFESAHATPSIDIKGLQLVRRDSPRLVKRISHGMLEILLYQRSFDLAMQFVQKEVLKILTGDVPFDEFIMSKAMRSSYKNQNLPHLIVARKRRERGQTPFRSGERVPFVYVQQDLDLGISQRAEDAEYARERGMSLDTLYYITNQVLTPLVTLLDLGHTQATQQILGYPDIAEKMVQLQAHTLRLKKTQKRVRTNTSNNQREITSFFKVDP